jgi:hypothetical protein
MIKFFKKGAKKMARHKKFDEAEVLQKAIVHFWRNG